MKNIAKLLAVALGLLALPAAGAGALDAQTLADLGLGYYMQGGQQTLPNNSASDWFYGCSPTSAGMAMGFYDRNGYNGETYANIVPGGVAPAQNIAPGPSILKAAIASKAYVNDYYSGASYPGTYWNGNNGSYGTSGDDVGTHIPTTVADFMGTSQDSVGTWNGATRFYIYLGGAKLHYNQLPLGLQDYDGMFGITEYVDYTGYDILDAYTQLTDNRSSIGFHFQDYVNEINAGRPVLVHIQGHTMLGVGYDDSNNTIQFHNTWDQGTYSMAWGGSYYGMDMWGVTAFEIDGGSVPDGGASLVLLAMGMLGLGAFRRIQA